MQTTMWLEIESFTPPARRRAVNRYWANFVAVVADDDDDVDEGVGGGGEPGITCTCIVVSSVLFYFGGSISTEVVLRDRFPRRKYASNFIFHSPCAWQK